MQQYASLCKVFLAYDIWHISKPLELLHNTLFLDAVLPQKKNDIFYAIASNRNLNRLTMRSSGYTLVL